MSQITEFEYLFVCIGTRQEVLDGSHAGFVLKIINRQSISSLKQLMYIMIGLMLVKQPIRIFHQRVVHLDTYIRNYLNGLKTFTHDFLSMDFILNMYL